MTKSEQAWCDAITQLGCIACIVSVKVFGTPGAVHHLLNAAMRRIGHKHTICLCDPGHHQYAPKGSGKVSRHPWKVRFVAAYGTEESLLELTKKLVKERGLLRG